ncbi:hypothetical protein [Candidatus Methylomirabilis sp.]|uniref:hypothetical protein n=1 Tax=Candidatus Methylomirabilis sp. TaxID=2032687 RepID=UPI002A62B921|nr:hypothetical protein [Candidatus Methylomirabilis sp.]
MQVRCDLPTSYAPTLLSAVVGLQPRAIAVYGLGVVAKTVLAILDGFNVVGLIDKDPANVGRILYGKVVLSDSSVRRQGVDLIIIAASDIYWRTISARIAPFCRLHGIRVLYMDGTLAALSEVLPTPPDIHQRAFSELEGLIAEHEVISFDLFETLVVRAATRSDDILETAVWRTKKELGYQGDLLSIRKEAEEVCCKQYGRYAFNLDAVYGYMKESMGISHAIADALQQAEIAMEIALSSPRAAMISLLSRCLRNGKTVCILTDTHLSRSMIDMILNRCAIPTVSHLAISSEEGASKHSGKLFAHLRSIYRGRRILHIGDGEHSDVTRAIEQGMRAFRVLSPPDLFIRSRLNPLLREACTTHDGVLLGMLARRLFADPFSSMIHGGRVRIHDLHQFGYVFFGPLLLTWLAWLIRNLRRRPADKLLFLAREGYLLVRLYNWLRAEKQLRDLPEGLYFATSRRMAGVASLRTAEDALALLDDDYSGSSEGLLRLRYGLNGSDAAVDDHLVHSDPEAVALVERYLDDILANARDEREAYLRYVGGLGITRDSRIAVADLGIKGSIQDALQRMLGKTMQGYYITGWFGSDNPYGMTDNTSALFPGSRGGEPSQVYRHHLLSESVLVAPEGMYLRIRADGSFINALGHKNQELFHHKIDIHEGIRSFIVDWLMTGIEPEETELSLPLIDSLYGQALADSVDIDETVKSVCYVDESYRADTEKRIWD